VQAINDSPVQTTAGVFTSVLQDSNNSTAVPLWSTAPVYDVGGAIDEASQTLSFTILTIPSFIGLFKADGTTPVVANASLNSGEFGALFYKTIASAHGSSALSFDVADSGSSASPNSNTLSGQSVDMTVVANDDDSDGASDDFEIGKDNNNDGVDDSTQATVATFAGSNGIGSLIIENRAFDQTSDPVTNGSLFAYNQLVFDRATADSGSTQGLQLSIANIDPAISVSSTSDLLSFSLSPVVTEKGDVSNLDVGAFTNRSLNGFRDAIQEVELVFPESVAAQDWNAIYKARKGKNNVLEYFLFNYDPLTGLGGVLMDRNGNGRVDGAMLYLKDGAIGDFDGVVNGEIVDPLGLATISSTPTLGVTGDAKGLKVDGLGGSGLWVKLSVAAFNSLVQSNLELYDPSSGAVYGNIGATVGSGPASELVLYLASGNSLAFRYCNGLGQVDSSPAIVIDDTSNGFRLGLDFNLDGIYADLILDISSFWALNSPENLALASKQRRSSDTILDLTDIAVSGLELTLDIATDCRMHNRFGFVRIDPDPIIAGAYSVGGVAQKDGAAFRSAVLRSFIDPYRGSGSSHGYGRSRQTITWKLESNQSGYYAPVMLSETGEVFTFGASTASDGRQHVVLLGNNIFGFEDLLAGQGSDWDFNDTKIRVSVAG
jgi:hypothetical protein